MFTWDFKRKAFVKLIIIIGGIIKWTCFMPLYMKYILYLLRTACRQEGYIWNLIRLLGVVYTHAFHSSWIDVECCVRVLVVCWHAQMCSVVSALRLRCLGLCPAAVAQFISWSKSCDSARVSRGCPVLHCLVYETQAHDTFVMVFLFYDRLDVFDLFLLALQKVTDISVFPSIRQIWFVSVCGIIVSTPKAFSGNGLVHGNSICHRFAHQWSSTNIIVSTC